MQIHSPTDEGTVRKEKVRAEFLGYKEVETIEKMEMWIETPWKYDMRQQNKKGREKNERNLLMKNSLLEYSLE